MWGRGIRKYRPFGMYLYLYDCQCKAGRYIFGFMYLRTKVTTNQKARSKELKNEPPPPPKKKPSGHKRENEKCKATPKRNIKLTGKQDLNGILVSSCFKCQWTKCSNQKIQSVRLDNKRTYNRLPIRDSL